MEIITAVPMGESVKLVGRGLRTGQVHDPILSAAQLAELTVSPAVEPFDGDPLRFRLGIEAERLGLAYEYERPSHGPGERDPRQAQGATRTHAQATPGPLVRRDPKL
ncbi:MAG: hypothetical protein JXA57_18510 [Armatimonadetes bacterium]|nr:hypothetical protein [Armatimonadota bacterium]